MLKSVFPRLGQLYGQGWAALNVDESVCCACQFDFGAASSSASFAVSAFVLLQ